MQTADSKSVGIIGAGRIGQAMAQTALRAGRQVVIANSRGPESLTSVVEALGDGASAGASLSSSPSWRKSMPFGFTREPSDRQPAAVSSSINSPEPC